MELQTIDINSTVWQAMCMFVDDFCEYEEYNSVKTNVFIKTQSRTNGRLVTKDVQCFADTLDIWKGMPREFFNNMMANLLEDTTKELANDNEVLNMSNFLGKVHNYLSTLNENLNECDEFGVKIIDDQVRVMLVTLPRCDCCGETIHVSHNFDHDDDDDDEEESIHEQIRRLPNSILGKHMTRLLSRH